MEAALKKRVAEFPLDRSTGDEMVQSEHLTLIDSDEPSSDTSSCEMKNSRLAFIDTDEPSSDTSSCKGIENKIVPVFNSNKLPSNTLCDEEITSKSK